ncbi:hypothetical protein KHQ84_gp051 [Rhodococcus phage Finch]|uniref:Uncharacterized protein n=1 Tax=Rhodococcus phage Finch TaxID=2094144 RepID=A0A2P1JXC7_9CAUD|nr:hypothetical protein KHQ84_gp051 [Rhodococcus phage Finch]AVO24991.1 hypothetical protein SEA_FINCH_51 [Rhodococcus phage Finch]
MSTLRMTCPGVGTIDLHVLNFNSPMVGEMRTSQTKMAKHHYPIRASQQSLQLNVVFAGWAPYRAMQDFVRRHHVRAMQSVEQPEVNLWWPERGMNNWTGVIKEFLAGDERFNIAPKAQIELLLVDSMLSEKTWTSSFGEDFSKFFETDIGDPTAGYTPPVMKPPATGGGLGDLPIFK